MFASSFKSLISKPVFTNTAFKSQLFASKTPFQAALLQKSFSRNFNRPSAHRPSTHATSSTHHTEDAFYPREGIVTPPPSGPNVNTIIESDINLNKFMSKIYRTTGLSIASSLGISYMLAASTAAVSMSPFVTIFGGLAMSIGGIVAMSRIQPQITLEKGAKGQMIEKWTNPPSRLAAFSAVIAGSGIMLSPFMQSLLFINPGIIPMAAGLSIMTMGGASLYAMYKPLGQFKSWESTLYGGLVGLIGMNVLSLLTTAIIGPNIFSLACSRVDMYIGLGLFTAFQAVDTQIAVQAYKDGNYDHLQHVINFFLNFKNIFVRIASILAQIRGDD